MRGHLAHLATPMGLALFLMTHGLVYVSAFGAGPALLFLASGLLVVWLRRRRLLDVLARYWPAFLVPAYAMATAAWSDSPALSTRAGIQLALTVLFAVLVADRVHPRRLVACFFVVFLSIAALSVALNDTNPYTGAWLGVFRSKNAFAYAMAILVVLSAGVLADRGGGAAMRALALLGMGLGLALIVLGQSLGALIMAVAVLATMAVTALVLRMDPGWRLVAVAVVALAGVGAALLVIQEWRPIMAFLTEATGKDPTLTGRTDLWALGLDAIAERPVLGRGYRAFWVLGNPYAQSVWMHFDVGADSGFTFHSVFVTNAAELGLAGLTITMALLFGALARCTHWLVRHPEPSALFFFGFLVYVVVIGLVETTVFLPFDEVSFLVVCAYVYAVRAARARPAGRRREASPRGRGERPAAQAPEVSVP